MTKEEDKAKMLNAIELVHQNVKLDDFLEDVLVRAVKQLKKGDMPSYVAATLRYRLSYYFMRHVGTKQSKDLDHLYKLSNEIASKYKGYFPYL